MNFLTKLDSVLEKLPGINTLAYYKNSPITDEIFLSGRPFGLILHVIYEFSF
jgi:hypothetical protein